MAYQDVTTEMVEQAIEKLHGKRTGMYWHDLSSFINGECSVRRNGNARIMLEFPIKSLSPIVEDVRALMVPHCYQNELIPFVVMVDIKEMQIAQVAGSQTADVDAITSSIVEKFRTFGGGASSSWGNPIAMALADKSAQFAAGVDVKEVVEFVLSQVSK